MGFRGRIAALLGPLAALSLALFPAGAQTASRQETWEVTTPVWAPQEVGPGERSLVLTYVSNFCGPERDLRVRLHETRKAVRLHITHEVGVRPPGSVPPPCAAPAQRPLTVRLARPLAGRAVRRANPAVVDHPHERLGIRLAFHERAPRLVGFAPADAARASRLAYLHPVVGRVLHAAGRRRVTARAPAPGSAVRHGQRIHLQVVGR